MVPFKKKKVKVKLKNFVFWVDPEIEEPMKPTVISQSSLPIMVLKNTKTQWDKQHYLMKMCNKFLRIFFLKSVQVYAREVQNPASIQKEQDDLKG